VAVTNSRATESPNPIADGCTCTGCQALCAEAGKLAALYARRLPIRGWAGKLSDAEKSFLRSHPPEWYRLVLGRMPGSASKPREQTPVASEDTSEVIDRAA
jgi:hypothetical protein